TVHLRPLTCQGVHRDRHLMGHSAVATLDAVRRWKISSMAASDWLLRRYDRARGCPHGWGGGLVPWRGRRPSGRRGRKDYRHAGYVDLIAAVDELMRALRLPRSATTSKSRQPPRGPGQRGPRGRSRESGRPPISR